MRVQGLLNGFSWGLRGVLNRSEHRGPARGPVLDTGADKLGIRAIRHTNKTYSSNEMEFENLEKWKSSRGLSWEAT